MDAQLFYGIRLDAALGADELGELREALSRMDVRQIAAGEGLPLIHSFGGADNSGGLFFGLPILDIAQGRLVGSISLSELGDAACSEHALARKAEADAAFAGVDGMAIREAAGLDGGAELAFIVVADSD